MSPRPRRQRRHQSKQDYGTSREFIDAVEARFGPLVCDLAASSANAKAPAFYDVDRDGLSVSWAHEHPSGNLWLNPPFGTIAPWAAKCAAEASNRGGLILMLTPASVSTDWFAASVFQRAMVLAIRPRITFEGGTSGSTYTKDLMLSVYGHELHGFGIWRWKNVRAVDRR